MRRRAIWQAGSAEWQMIDNARTSRHNSVTAMPETVISTSFDTPVQIIKQLRLVHSPLQADIVRLGSEDIEDAYRKIPVVLTHQCFSVIAARQPSCQGSGIQFATLSSMVFGLKSAVVNFNRFPALLIAALRRMLACAACPASHLVNFLFNAVGLPNADKKRNLPTNSLIHLGVVFDCRRLHQNVLLVAPKPGRIEALIHAITSILYDEAKLASTYLRCILAPRSGLSN
eukprot:1317891-Amphidinium_carterae.1